MKSSDSSDFVKQVVNPKKSIFQFDIASLKRNIKNQTWRTDKQQNFHFKKNILNYNKIHA